MRNPVIKNLGFTLIEVIIAIAIFTVVSVAIYSSYASIFNILILAKLRSSAITVAESEIEMIRNIPYPDVGVQGGSPSGNIAPLKVVDYGGTLFNVRTTVRNVDDSFDGILWGNPNDSIPSDYKLVHIEVGCASTCQIASVSMTTSVAPKDIEKSTKNGALFINVFSASGNPISGANVSIVNNLVNPSINISDTTNIEGSLNFVDIATSSAGYHIVITKNGYSSDRTYPLNSQSNPNPVKPDATVSEQDLTKISFAIDRVASVTFKAQDNMCKPISSLSFRQTGEKLVGTNPDVPKYLIDHQTDVNGQSLISNLEWDTYSFDNTTSTYDVIGFSPLMPLVVDPADSISAKWILKKATPNSILVTLIDENELPLDGVTVKVTGQGVDQTRITGQSEFDQTDWSNGQYASKTDGMDTNTVLGQLTLRSMDGKYATSSQELVSTTFDMGTSDTIFYGLNWNSISQPVQTGTDSLKFQVAANNDNSTWNFVGPNGNSNTYYTVSNTQLHSSYNGKRYLRYKVFMNTSNDQYTPALNDLNITFSSSCLSNGQAFFNNLPLGSYDINISKNGYDPINDTGVSITYPWQEYTEMLFVP